MKPLVQLFKWDLLLLQRNRLIVLSVVMAALYTGLFYLLKPLGNLETMLIILVFNDPVVTGFLFAGVLLLFDKNQNTLQALQVVPLPLRYYVLSKTLALSTLATLTAVVMVLAAHGLRFQYAHLLYGVFSSGALFTLFGFVLAARSRTFNRFLLYTIGFLMLMELPFLGLFHIGPEGLYLLFPSFAGLKMLQATFAPIPTWQLLYAYGYLALWVAGTWFYALRELNRQTI
jgi:fluoroquinolone transport system permease protein